MHSFLVTCMEQGMYRDFVIYRLFRLHGYIYLDCLVNHAKIKRMENYKDLIYFHLMSTLVVCHNNFFRQVYILLVSCLLHVSYVSSFQF